MLSSGGFSRQQSTPSPGHRLLLEARVGKRSFSISLAGMQRFVTEGQHLQLTAITKEQSGSYECIASNDISSPDVRIVQVTVNCKSQRNKEIKKKMLLLWTHAGGTGGGLKTFARKYLRMKKNHALIHVVGICRSWTSHLSNSSRRFFAKALQICQIARASPVQSPPQISPPPTDVQFRSTPSKTNSNLLANPGFVFYSDVHSRSL